MEYRLRRADGEFRWIFDQGAPRFEPDGTFAGFIGSCVDVTDLRQARDALRRSGEQLRGTIEAAPTGMILVDAVGGIVLVNSSVERVFGYPRHDLIGQPFEMLIPERFRGAHEAQRASFVRKPSSRAMAPGRELHGLRRDGSEVPIEIGFSPLRTPDGELVLVSIIDITERKRSEQERELLLAELQRVNADLSTTVGERDLLLQEIHHRVKNNLQVVSSLMNMQQRRLDESDPHRAFDDCRARVEAMASLHEQLFRRGDGDARVPFRDYAHSVAANAYRSSGEADRRVSLEVDIGDLWMHMDQAIPCGLILNELVTNSLRHAFPAGRAGHVRVTVRAVDEGTKEIELTVSDDGVGLPDEVNVDSPASLGLSLVSSFVEQLEGRLDVDRRGGTRTTLRFAQASTERPTERERGSHGSDLDRRG
jgi:PAS domain S-box-containing protein